MSTCWIVFNLVVGLVNVLVFPELASHVIGCFNLLAAGMLAGVVAMDNL